MTNYELLWECYRSEQMTFSQLEQHMNEDPAFKEWVMEKFQSTSIKGS